ncbi:MAG: UDP-N-acetylmuramoyl-tripeptide--D-alanyl-D-alanine ligase [Patescibacteria group bacterium]
MKFFKKIVQKILRLLARLILNKYQPEIIGITGSFGKTSTKEAIYTVLSKRFNVRENIKNYNNEIGLPLTIIGAGSGGRSVWGWVGVFAKALVLLIWKDKRYPEILVLEMAVDRVGDMKYLTDLAPCKIGVVTNIGPVHLEFFKTLERIAKEKSVIVSQLTTNGWAILNADNDYVRQMAEETKARIMTYGILEKDTSIRASEIIISQNNQEEIAGLSFKLSYRGSTVPVFLPNILGEHLIYAALAAAAIGLVYEMNLLEISEALRLFKAPSGRMNLLVGIKQTKIIDDSYNAGPDSMLAALKVLGKINGGGRKIAVLGDMLELGDYTDEGHRQVGAEVVKNKIDILITVGERARTIAAESQRQGLDSDLIFNFSDTERAGSFLQERMEEGDLVLVKGSQGMRMEKIVKEIMAEPLRAKELLVRQEKPWN